MKLLKLEIKESELVNKKKLLLWAVATLCFNGAFRIHELLSHTEKQFDPNFTLLLRDINLKTLNINKVSVNIIQVRIKSPKTDRIGVDAIIDVYKSKGPLCLVKAFKNGNSALRKCQTPPQPSVTNLAAADRSQIQYSTFPM